MGAQGFDFRAVAPNVACELFPPKVGIVLRNRQLAANAVSMPKAAVDENDLPVPCKHYIRPTWQILVVQPESEAKMMKAVEENLAVCGIPSSVPKEMKASHAKASELAKQVCDVAAQGPRPAGPSLSDALGTAPTVPDATHNKRGGAFDTLSGSILAR